MDVKAGNNVPLDHMDSVTGELDTETSASLHDHMVPHF